MVRYPERGNLNAIRVLHLIYDATITLLALRMWEWPALRNVNLLPVN